MAASTVALRRFVAVEQWKPSNIHKEYLQEPECRATVKTPLIQVHQAEYYYDKFHGIVILEKSICSKKKRLYPCFQASKIIM